MINEEYIWYEMVKAHEAGNGMHWFLIARERKEKKKTN